MTKFAMLAAVDMVPTVIFPRNTSNRPINSTTGKIRLLMREVFTTTAFRLCW